MSLSTHIETLQQKHALLERMIGQESARPLPDFSRINQMKKQKLVIKEELYDFSRLRTEEMLAS
jgi:hypothetical protein